MYVHPEDFAPAAPHNAVSTSGVTHVAALPSWRRHAVGMAVVGLMASGLVQAQETPQVTASSSEAAQASADAGLPAVSVREFRGTEVKGVKYTRDLQDTPRIITVLPEALLQEQNTQSLKDAMRNLPGISLQTGEGNPPSGDQFKIRGFNARDDINVNGTRDLGNYFRDPFYVDQLEVVKGPNSTFSGRGSAGGTVNFVTKTPQRKAFGRAEATLGTDGLVRGTLDVNRPIDDNSAVRLNVMAHQSDLPGRDVANEKRNGLYAAYTWGFKEPTRITADYLYVRQNDLPDNGLPLDRGNLLGQGGKVPSGLDFDNFYGHTNDYKDVAVDQLGLSIQHAFRGGAVLKNQTRYSVVRNDSITSSPRISTAAIGANPTDGIITSCSQASPCAVGNTKPRDQSDTGINNQTDLVLHFQTGALTHDLVTGVEFAHYTYENRRRRDTNGPLTSLYNPAERVLPGARWPVYDGTTYTFRTRELGLYLLDTIKFNEQWELNAGIRHDRVAARAQRWGFEGGLAANNTQHDREDSETSYSLGLVHKLTPSTSLYAAYGTAFNIAASFDRNQVQLAGGGATENIVGAGFNTPPEQMTAYELGAKWQVGAGLDVNFAVFRTQTKEGRFPAQDSGGITIPNAAYHVNGLELLSAGKVTKAWRLYAGYVFLDSEVTRVPGDQYAVGQELGGSPRHTFSLFTTYDLNAKWNVGVGMQAVAKQTSGVQPTATSTLKITIPGYAVADLYATYRFTPQTQLRMTLSNAFDKRHISQLAEGGGQGIPGRGRQLVATLRHDF